MTLTEYRKAIHNGAYAWPGGYPIYFICDDGAALCFNCAKKERRNIIESICRNIRDGWNLAATDINYEDTELVCAHCGKPIEAAYKE